MANDPERDRELRLLEQEAERLDEDFEHLADQWEWVHQRIQHLKRERRPHLRVLRGGALGAVGAAAGAAWHKAATHPGTASGMLAALAIAIATPWVMDGPRPNGPSMAIPNPPSMSPPGVAPPEQPTTDTAPPTEDGREPAEAQTAVPIANPPDTEAQLPATAVPRLPSAGASPPSEPDGRNETEPPQEPPDTTQPPEPEPSEPPDCTGLHVDASPVAEACVLGESVLEAEVLGG